MPDSINDLKHKIQVLDDQVRDGALSADAAASARSQLEQALVAAVLATPAAPGAAKPTAGPASPQSAAQAADAGAAPPRPSVRLVLGLAVFVLAFGAAGYAWLGSPAGWATAPGQNLATAEGEAPAAEGGASAPHSNAVAQIEAMVGKLADRMKQHPEDAEGWLMLGRSYAVLSRFDDAQAAYRKVLALQPKNAQALADLADVLAVSQGGTLDGEPTRLIKAALAADPDNLKALSLSGTLAFLAKDYTGALKHWERVVAIAPPDSGLAQQVRENVAEARQLAGLPPAASAPTLANAQATGPGNAPAGPSTPSLATPPGSAITGRVELAPALAAKAAPDDTVFIFARPAEGSRMPLAILKKQARDLPFNFTLDDSLAMSPAARLSQASSVIVGARLSKSGQAMPQPGDLQGQSAAVKPGASGLTIVIGEEVR